LKRRPFPRGVIRLESTKNSLRGVFRVDNFPCIVVTVPDLFVRSGVGGRTAVQRHDHIISIIGTIGRLVEVALLVVVCVVVGIPPGGLIM